MTNTQLCLTIGVPLVFNTITVLLVFWMLSGRLEAEFAAVNQKFEDMRDLWRAELRSVEESLNVRLKRLEDPKVWPLATPNRGAAVNPPETPGRRRHAGRRLDGAAILRARR
jgi:hypothetical protein